MDKPNTEPPARNLCQGRIVWATVVDPQGANSKTRPLVIITVDAEIAGSDEIAAVAASHSAARSTPLPPDCVVLPHHPQGKVRTRLRKPTVAFPKWIVKLNKNEILEIGGIVPPFMLKEIIARATASDRLPPSAENPT